MNWLQVFLPISQPLPGWLGFMGRGVFHARNAPRDCADGRVLHKHGSGCQSGLAKAAIFYACPERRTASCFRFRASAPLQPKASFGRHRRSEAHFFATYFNHSNAGAFINLTLPIVAGQTILAFQNKKGQFERALWSFLLIVSVTAVFVNTSRASMVIGLVIIGSPDYRHRHGRGSAVARSLSRN